MKITTILTESLGGKRILLVCGWPTRKKYDHNSHWIINRGKWEKKNFMGVWLTDQKNLKKITLPWIIITMVDDCYEGKWWTNTANSHIIRVFPCTQYHDHWCDPGEWGNLFEMMKMPIPASLSGVFLVLIIMITDVTLVSEETFSRWWRSQFMNHYQGFFLFIMIVHPRVCRSVDYSWSQNIVLKQSSSK